MLYISAYEGLIIAVVFGVLILGPPLAGLVLAAVRRWRARLKGESPPPG